MKRSAVLIASGAALVAAFFLPWAMGKSGFDLALSERAGWGHYLFFLIPALGALAAGLAVSKHSLRVGAAIFAGMVSLGLTIYLWTKAMPTDKLEFWIVAGAAAAAIYLVATKADAVLFAVPGLALVAAYLFRLDVSFVVMVLGAALAVAGLTKHRSSYGLAIALPILVVAPMVELTARVFHRRAEYGMWIIVVAAVVAIGSGVASASSRQPAAPAE